jgi:hypothetical protein
MILHKVDQLSARFGSNVHNADAWCSLQTVKQHRRHLHDVQNTSLFFKSERKREPFETEPTNHGPDNIDMVLATVDPHCDSDPARGPHHQAAGIQTAHFPSDSAASTVVNTRFISAGSGQRTRHCCVCGSLRHSQHRVPKPPISPPSCVIRVQA